MSLPRRVARERVSPDACRDDEGGDSDDCQNKGFSDISTGASRDFDSVESQSTSSEQKPSRDDLPILDDCMDVSRAKGGILGDACGSTPSCLAGALCSTEAQGAVLQLLCRMWTDGSSGLMVAPCIGDDVVANSDLGAFWCCAQTQPDGSVLLAPCTEASACGVKEDAAGLPLDHGDEVLGAPRRPPRGSYVPAWVYGATWPFCVAPTTLILSSLPDHLLQEDLIEILDKAGFGSFYDFIYLPMDPELQGNEGYAIVNLTRHDYGLALAALMYGRESWCGVSSPACQVTWSIPLQGITQLTEHYRDHPACRENVPMEMRPMYFDGGFPKAFP